MSYSHRGLSAILALLFSALLLSFFLLSCLSLLADRSRFEVDRDVASWFPLALARVDSLDREIALMIKRQILYSLGSVQNGTNPYCLLLTIKKTKIFERMMGENLTN